MVRRQKHFPPYRRSKHLCGRKRNIRGKPSGLSPKRKHPNEVRIFLEAAVMDEKRQIQKELFEEFIKADRKKHPKGIFHPRPRRTITLSYEHLIFIVMTFIITAAVFFSLGVERGKRLKVKSFALAEKKSKQTPVRIAEVPETVQKEPATGKEETSIQPKKLLKPKKEKLATAYTVQVASYVKKDTADKEASRLKKKGFKPFVFSSGNYYIVCVGEFTNKAKATSLQKRLRKLYPDCYVKKKIRSNDPALICQ